MVFDILLYISLGIFSLGLVVKVFFWFSRKIGYKSEAFTTSERLVAAVKGIAGIFFSLKIFTLLKVFIDILFQIHMLKENPLRWLMHILIIWGFILLLLMHALDDIITMKIFDDYYSTLNPYLCLRNVFGVIVIAGLSLAVWRRLIIRVPRMKSNAMDYYAIIILVVIIFSGILLEGMQIASPTVFSDMQEEYADLDEESDIQALESFWVKEYGLASAIVKEPFGQQEIEWGQELNEEYCASCHASNKWAFAGYATARMLRPVAVGLDNAGALTLLWYLHVLACLFGLAYLPFSKMFHVIATPVSLLANSVMSRETSSPANTITRQIIELDACTHCCTCSLHCSAMMASKARGNPYILPSEKMVILRDMVKGKKLTPAQHGAIVEGIYLCTNCDRCTVVCPSGINLKELWMSVREDLVQKQGSEPMMLSPFSLVRGLNRNLLSDEAYAKPLQETQKALAGEFDEITRADRTVVLQEEADKKWLLHSDDTDFSCCFGCQICTTVCPVVKNYENPAESLGLLPHQIMYCLGTGLTDAASGARMLWVCLTCYQCQEHCPQQVKVTDLLYELKNKAVQKLEN
jgi:heterodisulfide reductase subunit C